MTSKHSVIFALFFVSTVGSTMVHAETYQWKDGNGQTVVSDSPPPSTVKAKRSIGGSQPAVISEAIDGKTTDSGKPTDTPKTMAEKDLEFKKRQQEAREKADKLAKEQAAAKDKQENCERARRNLAALEANQPMVNIGENGERKLIDSAQREQEMERTRQFMTESCK